MTVEFSVGRASKQAWPHRLMLEPQAANGTTLNGLPWRQLLFNVLYDDCRLDGRLSLFMLRETLLLELGGS